MANFPTKHVIYYISVQYKMPKSPILHDSKCDYAIRMSDSRFNGNKKGLTARCGYFYCRSIHWPLHT